jgi:hypothetical protein
MIRGIEGRREEVLGRIVEMCREAQPGVTKS